MVSIGDMDQPLHGVFQKRVHNCADTWNVIWHKQHTASRWRLIWYSLAIPRQALILWSAAHDSLTPGVRLLSWGFGGNVLCVLCRSCIEGRSRLYFECSF
jgi:hypothetical protein